jgi:hypothetical protein
MSKRNREARRERALRKSASRAETRLVSLAATHDSTPLRLGVEQFQQARIVYRLDADLAESLMATDLKVVPPRTSLTHLPHDTFVVTFDPPLDLWDDEDKRGRRYEGVLVTGLWPVREVGANHAYRVGGLTSADIDTVRGTYYGSFADDGTPQLTTASIELDIDMPLEEFYAFRHGFDVIRASPAPPLPNSVAADRAQPTLIKDLGRLLWQVLLYLSSPEPDFVPAAPEPIESNSKARRPEPQVFDVGWRVGEALRQARASKSSGTDLGGGLRAHVRRGHWHTYLYGSRASEERERRLKWVHPTIVNRDQGPIGGVVFDADPGGVMLVVLNPNELGRTYCSADEQLVPQEATEEEVGSPDLRGRGARAHARLQNELAGAVRAAGYEPRSPSVDDPQYDLSWRRADGVIVVVEVKSLSWTTETHQLRLGVGQVIQYRWNLAELYHTEVVAVLFVEREPTDRDWVSLCESEGIILAWPETLPRVLAVHGI